MTAFAKEIARLGSVAQVSATTGIPTPALYSAVSGWRTPNKEWLSILIDGYSLSPTRGKALEKSMAKPVKVYAIRATDKESAPLNQLLKLLREKSLDLPDAVDAVLEQTINLIKEVNS